MATVYYVKDGPRPTNSGPGYNISLPDLESKVSGQRVHYLGTTPPEFNKDNPSLSTRYVVVEVEPNEPLGNLFNKLGFFLLLDLSPEEAHPIIFQGTPPPFKF